MEQLLTKFKANATVASCDKPDRLTRLSMRSPFVVRLKAMELPVTIVQVFAIELALSSGTVMVQRQLTAVGLLGREGLWVSRLLVKSGSGRSHRGTS